MAKALVYVTYKQGVLDPQGEAVRGALSSLGFEGVERVRVGKYIEIDVTPRDGATVEEEVARMCQELLANPVIENYRIEVPENQATTPAAEA